MFSVGAEIILYPISLTACTIALPSGRFYRVMSTENGFASNLSPAQGNPVTLDPTNLQQLLITRLREGGAHDTT
jgi:hypothetical protein